MKKSILLLLITCMALLPAVHADDRFTERSHGRVVYFPTLAQADDIVEHQLPNGLVPEHPDSAVVTAEDSAGKLLVLSTAYKYTGEGRYLEARTRLQEALEAVNATYGYLPRYMRLNGMPLTVHDDGGTVADAITLAGIIQAENLSQTVTLEDPVTIGCAPQGDTNATGGDTGDGDGGGQSSCPFDITTTESGDTPSPSPEPYTYQEGADRLLTVTYTVPYSILSKDISASDIQIAKVVTQVDDEEVEVAPDGCLGNGIRVELLDGIRERILREVARQTLASLDMKLGFTALSPDDATTPLQRAAYQARVVIEDGGAIPWNVVQTGVYTELKKYTTLASEYSLLQGAMYLPGLVQENATLTYTAGTGVDLTYSDHDPHLEIKGSSITYTEQDLEPKFEGVYVTWHPVSQRRVQLAGSFSGFLESKFGLTLTLGNPVTEEVVSVLWAPAGEHTVTVTASRASVITGETLSGTVHLWKPKMVGDTRATIVKYPTLDPFQATRYYQMAVENQDPEKFFVAADNLWLHRIGAGSTDLNQGVPGVVKALYSLSDTDINEAAGTNTKLRSLLYKWRDYYTARSLKKAQDLVGVSLQEDTYSKDLEEFLARLSQEAALVGLTSADKLQDLYTGYRDYWGPHTKDYENLKAMAQHLPEYRRIVQAIEEGDYARAQDLIASLPEGTVKQILQQEVTEASGRLGTMKDEAYAATKTALEGTGSTDTAVAKLEAYLALADDDREARFVLSTLTAYRDGVVSEDRAREALSDVGYFSDWIPEEPAPRPVEPEPEPVQTTAPRPPVETYEPQVAPRDQTGQGKHLVVGVLVLAGGLVLGGAVYYRRKQKPAPRRR